jgi:glycosyltransferase involved in cell wall biosynthesis
MTRKLALVTDAWHPQTNGVVNTLDRLVRDLTARGVEVRVLAPEPTQHRTFQMPLDQDYQLAWDPWRTMARIRAFNPDAVHVATEGPLGLWVNQWMRGRGLAFTTSFHTRFPEYLEARFRVPLRVGNGMERWFHRAASHTLVGTRSLMRELAAERIGKKLVLWPRGVDARRYHPSKRRTSVYEGLPGPIWLFVGRVAPEKSVEDFLRLTLPGTKVVVGDGPARARLERAFPSAVFRGFRFGEDLAAHYASADCFVFPSRTDTFGNVILEALASGLPVAAVPAPGPVDLISDGVNGAVGDDLGDTCLRALRCRPEAARASVGAYTYEACCDVFYDALVPLRGARPARATPRVALAAE